MGFSLRVNGVTAVVEARADTPLLWILREVLGLTGTKYGCGGGHCGSCMVLINGKAKPSCMIPVARAAKVSVTTIEGISGAVAERVIAAWREVDAAECGYCMSGQIISAVALLTSTPQPTDDQIAEALDRNICRCAAYAGIRRAIRRAADAAAR